MPETAPGAFAPSASHVSGPQWQSFELRMRQRRAARLAARAQAALEEGQVAEAEEALQEARTLDSSAPDLETLRARIGVSASPVAEPQPAVVASEATAVAPEILSREPAVSAPEPAARAAKRPVVASRPAVVGAKPPVVAAKPSVVAPLVAVVAPEPATRKAVAPAWEPDFLRDPATIPVVGNRGASRGIRVAGAAAASLLLVTSFALWNGRAWRSEFVRREAANTLTTPQTVAPEPVAATAGQIAVPPPGASGSVAAPAVEPSPVDTAPTPQLSVPSSMSPARAPEAEPEPDEPAAPPPSVTAVQPTATAQPITTVQTLRDEPVHEPPARDGIESALPVTAPPPTQPVVAPLEPPPAPEPQRVDETPFVRQVLSQYAAAYSSLDASAAKRVWPSLDTGALSRAFAGLESQRVSLGTCSITFGATSARADCRGSAEWTPKVGGGSRSAARRWSFDLRKTGGQWRIVDAIVQ